MGVPTEFVGHWKLIGQECEPNASELPPKRNAQADLNLQADGSYFLTVEGFPMPGRFNYEALKHGSRITFERSLLHFEMKNGRLENWSEGDSPYLCGNIFVRDE